MKELIAWLKEQNEGVCTYIGIQQRAYGLALSDPDQAALFRLLGALAARFASSYDDMPLPANIARPAFERVMTLVEEALRTMDGTAEEKLAVLNEIARTDLN
jgi:Ser/Thr protein kinase RdoA (MazF antagonist)